MSSIRAQAIAEEKALISWIEDCRRKRAAGEIEPERPNTPILDSYLNSFKGEQE